MGLINDYRNDIEALCVKHEVKRLYAFGSVMSDQYKSGSDVDLIVDFNPLALNKYADNYFDLKFALENIFNRSVDLLEERAIRNPFFKKNVENTRRLIYEYRD